ncbi:MAG: transposase [Patescibacteria group bacterium]|nr:MAG: transposase [Patescibacteria group bacterium]GIW59849.1 MAG: transposase [Patescibacteria group bacterium]GIW59907.1 MAG: transposase [Patescibacteria group bacterium]GIW60382.1 MAG: transposase [Patescibacteria group bacterium]GIW60394.1 MAG: transposase [Patescibacteria group bacterium]
MLRSPPTSINKTQLARELGVSRSSLYYTPKKEATDVELKRQIESVMVDHPSYGHKRIALHLKMGHNRIRRVMKKYGLKPYRRRAKTPIKKKDRGKKDSGIPNLVTPLLSRNGVSRPSQVWCTDFTYIKYQGKFIYLATIIDVYTREIVGVNISRFHNRFLVIGALKNATQAYDPPDIVHSDQGSEYDSDDFMIFVKAISATPSMSQKGSPWQNGHQESFFGHFKKEAGDLNRFESLGELIEYIYGQIYYYNHKRIHSVLKMTPHQKRENYCLKN